MPYLKKYVQDSKRSFLEQFLSHVSKVDVFPCRSYWIILNLPETLVLIVEGGWYT